MISVGSEVFANVWGPESLISDVLIGRLNGHIKPLVDSKFIGKTPFNMTVDVGNSIRIWDIRTLTCMQLINGKNLNEVFGLLPIDNQTVWTYGRRFVQYDTISVNDSGEEKKATTSDLYPLWAEFNFYYHNIVVVNKYELASLTDVGLKLSFTREATAN